MAAEGDAVDADEHGIDAGDDHAGEAPAAWQSERCSHQPDRGRGLPGDKRAVAAAETADLPYGHVRVVAAERHDRARPWPAPMILEDDVDDQTGAEDQR